jgi:hypothetical protein
MRKYHIVLFCVLSICLLFILLSVDPSQAQSGARVDLVDLQTGSFPTINALVDVYNAQGDFVSGLLPENVTVLEDGQSLPVDDMSERQTGLQLVVAVNQGQPLMVRDEQGIARYERAVQILSSWMQTRQAENPDDLSLVTTSGILISHATSTDWQNSFSTYQPSALNETPGLQALAFAFEVVDDPLPQAGMKRAILFLTPHLDDPLVVDELKAVAEHAAQARIRVYVWLIDSPTDFFHASATALKSLAIQTGGAYFAFSGIETFPDPESYFASLRRMYALNYASKLRTSGKHRLALQVQLGGEQLTSSEMTFDLDIQPPNPIMVSPPLQIVRQAPPEKPYEADVLVPTEQTIEMLVEFPDGHPRLLVHSSLYVDGQVVVENTSEPFGKFVWDVSGYLTSGEHSLQVEVEDVLGLRKTSMSIPVTVTIVRPPSGVVAILARNSAALTIAAILLVGILLALILFSGGRKRLQKLAELRQARKLYEDPVTQPVEVHPGNRKRKVNHIPRRAGTGASRLAEAPAYLVRLTPDGEPATGNPIPLVENEMTFGTNPVQATHILDDESVSPLHAAMQWSKDGVFTLSDKGSVAGTWVNYEPVTGEGRRLVHGDLIHIGQLMYRFTLRNAPPPPTPKISVEKTGS